MSEKGMSEERCADLRRVAVYIPAVGECLDEIRRLRARVAEQQKELASVRGELHNARRKFSDSVRGTWREDRSKA